MLKPLLHDAAAAAAGVAVVALLDALLLPAGNLPAAYGVALAGAGLLTVPFVVVASLRGRQGGAARLGTLLAGGAVAAAPLLAELLPFSLAAALAVLLAAALVLFAPTVAALDRRLPLRATLPAACFALLMLGWAVQRGGVDGREELLLELPPAQAEAVDGPDVILVSVDTLRADAVVGPRPEGYTLPVLDRLRAEGTWAPAAYSCSNQTLPGHVGMLTGLDAMEHGVRFNQDLVPTGMPWLASSFRDAGRRTAAVVSNPLLFGDFGFGTGFDVYDDSLIPARADVRSFAFELDGHSWLRTLLGMRRFVKLVELPFYRGQRASAREQRGETAGQGARTTDHALALMDMLLDEQRPYFLFVHYMDPHTPYGTVAPFQGSLTADREGVAERYLPRQEGINLRQVNLLEEELESEDPQLREEAARAAAWYHLAYLEEVAFIDAEIGRLLARAEESGRPTVLLFTSDHGEHFGEHGLTEHAKGMYRESLDVPWVLWGAGVDAGVELEEAPDLTDVAPTLLHYSGLPIPEQLGGRVSNRGPARPDRVSLATDHERFALIQAPGKFVGRWTPEAEAPLEDEAWYDHSRDATETRNFLDELPALVRRLVEEAVRRDQRSRVEALADQLSEFQLELNKQLGYVD